MYWVFLLNVYNNWLYSTHMFCSVIKNRNPLVVLEPPANMGRMGCLYLPNMLNTVNTCKLKKTTFYSEQMCIMSTSNFFIVSFPPKKRGFSTQKTTKIWYYYISSKWRSAKSVRYSLFYSHFSEKKNKNLTRASRPCIDNAKKNKF